MVQALDAGGTERQLTEIAKALDRSQFAPHVACFRDGGMRLEELRRAGIPVLLLPIASFRSWDTVRAVRTLGRYIRKHGIRLVHTFDTPANFFGVPASRLLRAPIVLSSQRALRGLRGPGARRVFRFTDRLVDGIVVNSLAVRDSLIREDGVAPRRIHLCYNGIDLERFPFRPRTACTGRPLVIAFLGVLRREKGLDTLLEAVRRLAVSEPGAELHLIGWGPMKDALQEQSRTLGIDHLCCFDPATSQVAETLAGVDIFVLPSLSESFSNSLMEAMACGCAVVASRTGGNPELVEHGRTGLLFEPGDSADLARQLRILIGDPQLRESLGCNAAERIHAGFGLPHAAQAMGEIYREFLPAS
jgi:glycosyltransferase involved in cell wall biosynthesis